MRNPAGNILLPVSPAELFKTRRTIPDTNIVAHEQLHSPRIMTWTSKATLDTTAGSRIYVPHYGQMVRARANVQTAPTSTLTWDILKNGVSVFGTKPTILNGNNFQAVTEFLDNAEFVPDDYFQCQVVTVAAAVGPMVVEIVWIPIDFA